MKQIPLTPVPLASLRYGAGLTLSPEGRGNVEEENILKQFSHEPGIREVQDVAIEYAEVHPIPSCVHGLSM